MRALILEYYQLPFKHLHEHATKKYYRAHIQIPQTLRQTRFLAKIEPTRKYSQSESWSLCFEYLTAIEDRMNRLLSKHSVFYWLSIIRRTRPGLPSYYDNKVDDHTSDIVRKIQELAIRKFGSLSRYDDVRLASTVGISEILGGWFEAIHRDAFGEKTLHEMYELIKSTPQWLICDFGLTEFMTIPRLEGLAYEYWQTSAALRTIGKGASISYARGDKWITFIEENRDQSKLIESYDQRIGKYNSASTLLGTWLMKQRDRNMGVLVAAHHNVTDKTSNQELNKTLGMPSNFVQNFSLSFTDILQFWNSHKFMATAFRQTHSIRLSVMLSTLWWMGNRAMITDGATEVLFNPYLNDEQKEAVITDAFNHLLSRGYTTMPNDEEIGLEFHARMKHFGTNLEQPAPENDEISRAIKWLTLTPDVQNRMSIWSSGPYLPIIPHGNAFVVDFVALPYITQNMFVRVRGNNSANKEKGKIFEEEFLMALKRSGLQLAFSGEIEDPNVKVRKLDAEIDASVRIGSTLYLLECYASERPLDFEIGKGTTIVTRCESLMVKVNQTLRVRQYLLEHPIGKNYDFSWATKIEAYVVSPFVEWIWSTSEDLWIKDVPRILAADECLQYLKTQETVYKKSSRKSHRKQIASRAPDHKKQKRPRQ